jgi:hypothetical protein
VCLDLAECGYYRKKSFSRMERCFCREGFSQLTICLSLNRESWKMVSFFRIYYRCSLQVYSYGFNSLGEMLDGVESVCYRRVNLQLRDWWGL